MGGFDELKDKGEKFASDHPDQVEKGSDQAIQHGGDAADKATGDKYAKNVDQAQEKADSAVGDNK
jgi:hypothetical protein